MGNRPIVRKDANPEQIANAKALSRKYGSVQAAVWEYLEKQVPFNEEFHAKEIAYGLGIHTAQVSGPLNRFNHSDIRLEKVNARTYVLREKAQKVVQTASQTAATPKYVEVATVTPTPHNPFVAEDGSLVPVPAYVLQQDGHDFLMWFQGQLFVATPFA